MEVKEIKNYMEDWEDDAVQTSRQHHKFKVINKDMGIAVGNKEDGNSAYNDVRKICAII